MNEGDHLGTRQVEVTSVEISRDVPLSPSRSRKIDWIAKQYLTSWHMHQKPVSNYLPRKVDKAQKIVLESRVSGRDRDRRVQNLKIVPPGPVPRFPRHLVKRQLDIEINICLPEKQVRVPR